MGKIRVLHFVSTLSKSSGVMSAIMNYYRHINRNNVQFDFIYFRDSDNSYEEEINSYDGRVYLIPEPSLKKAPKIELIKIFKESKYIALHNHVTFLTFFIAPLAKKNGIKNIITHSHNPMHSDKFFNSIRNHILSLRLKKHATHYFACSKAAGSFLYGKKSLAAGEITVINNAIDCKKFEFNVMKRNQIRKELNLEENFVVGHVGRFNKQKNHEFLIDVFAEIKKKEEKAKLVLIGDGPLKNKIKTLIKKHRLENDVLFLGVRSDVNDLMQAMDFFVFPSLFEGLGIVLVEAQVSGLPIITSDIIPNEARITDLLSVLSLSEKAEQWSSIILNRRNIDRKNKIKEVREAGFDISIEAKKLEDIYINMSNI